MPWKNHIILVEPHISQPCYEVDQEMRSMIGEWFDQQYGINPGIIDFQQIGENFCQTEIIVAGGHSNNIVAVQLIVHGTGRVEQTLCIYCCPGDVPKKVKLSDGQLPPDNEDFAAMVSRETCHSWTNRPVGWHASHEQIIAVMTEYIHRNGCELCMTVAGFYPDGTETLHMCEVFDLNPNGLRDALCIMRADLKGAQAWQENYNGEQDEGNFSIMLIPGRGGPPPEDDSYFFLDPATGYTSLVSNVDDHRWDNILPM